MGLFSECSQCAGKATGKFGGRPPDELIFITKCLTQQPRAHHGDGMSLPNAKCQIPNRSLSKCRSRKESFKGTPSEGFWPPFSRTGRAATVPSSARCIPVTWGQGQPRDDLMLSQETKKGWWVQQVALISQEELQTQTVWSCSH